MPLDEVQINVQRSQSTRQSTHKATENGNTISSHVPPPPTAIQGMLKSTTETGDGGMFARRPPRIPRSSTQTSLGAQSRSSAATSTHPHHHRHRRRLDSTGSRHRSHHASPPGAIRRNDTVRSSQTAYHYNPRSRRPRSRLGPYPYQQGAFPGGNQHALHSHRSLVSLRTAAGTNNQPSPIPRSYHGRGGSPAFSNLYEYRNYGRSGISRHGSLVTAASSPRSMASVGRSLQDYRNDYNGSVVSMRPLPSPALRGYQHQPLRHPAMSRAMTPSSIAAQNAAARDGILSESAPTSPTGSIVPFYYDYSESFYGSDALLNPSVQHLSIPEAGEGLEDVAASSIGEDSSSQSATCSRWPSGFNLVELPTRHNRRPSEQSFASRHSRKSSNRSNRSTRLASENFTMQDQEPLLETDERETQSDPGSHTQSPKQLHLTVGRNSTNSPRNWPTPSSSTFFTNACRSPRNLSDLAARAHSPDAAATIRDVPNIDSIAQQQTHHAADHKAAETTTAGNNTYRLPTPKFRPLSIGMSKSLRPLTSPISVVHGVAEIVSPKPERPTSSQSRKRFSKILDIDLNQSIIESYSVGFPSVHASATKLGPVKEAYSPARTPETNTPRTVSTGKRGKSASHSVGPPSTRGRWSVVTSHDISTVESLLESHIECLGLRHGHVDEPNPPFHQDSGAYQPEAPKHAESADGPAMLDDQDDSSRPKTSDSNRPTSLSSSAQRNLVPRRLFASMDMPMPKFPLASSESDARFSLSWSDAKMRPSHGWLALPSESNIKMDGDKSIQTLLSGEYADVDSSITTKKFKLRRHSSPTLTPVSKAKDLTTSHGVTRVLEDIPPCQRAAHNTIGRESSKRRRKIKLHLKTERKLPGCTSDEWTSTEDRSEPNELEMRRLGMTRLPYSTVDGFAELSGDSANASQQSLTSILNGPKENPPDTWSSIVDAMPMPARRPTGTRQKGSVNTVHSHRSKLSIVEPVNNSRMGSRKASHEMKPQSSIPRLAQPDLGPSMRVSQFDLSSGYRMKSPGPRQSSFSEPKDLLAPSPPKHGRHSMRPRKRLSDLRHIMPSSIRSFTFSPQTSISPQHPVVPQTCQYYNRPDSFTEPTTFPETVAMSDFAYRKHKFLEKIKGWCRRRCGQKPPMAKRRRSFPSGLLIL